MGDCGRFDWVNRELIYILRTEEGTTIDLAEIWHCQASRWVEERLVERPRPGGSQATMIHSLAPTTAPLGLLAINVFANQT